MTEARETITLEVILNFWSGLEKPPPLGFDPRPTLRFIEGNLATASVCSYEMKLPLGPEDYATFKECMTLSLVGHCGFGVA